MDGLGLGVVVAVIGLLFFLAARLLVRAVPGLRPAEGLEIIAPAERSSDLVDAVLVIQAGGKVRSLNDRARKVFRLQEGELPDLERMARLARPADAFIHLCAAEGQQSFSLDGRFVEGRSYRLAFTQEPLVLVSLHFSELVAGLAGSETGSSAQTLQTFNELTSAIAASLDFEQTLQAVLENVEKLVPADFLEITIWDSEVQQLVPYHYAWISNSERALNQMTQRYSPGEGYSGYLYRERKALLIPDVDKNFDVRPVEGRTPGMRSYLGVPLLVGQEFVGTLELASRTSEAYREEDLAVVRLLSGQAAIAIHNALIYRQEQKRSAELSGLSQLTQAFSSVRDPKSLYTRLVGSIAPLLQVEILGFLTYNEAQRVLEAQIPFHGLPDQIVELYRAAVPVNSMAEQVLLDQDVLISEDASSDPQWEVLGLSFVAQAASLRETVLVPLNSGGHMLGYLQASNRLEGGGFTQSELHLLTIVANQTASIIENASLVQQSRIRAQRAEALRRIASLASSAANLDEIIQYSIQELARLLRADAGAIFLLDQPGTLLQLHEPSVFGNVAVLPERSRRMMVDDPEFPFTVTGSQRALLTSSPAEDKAIVPFYRSIFNQWEVQSVIVVPLVVRSQGIGELWFASRQPGYFDNTDVQMVATAAGQLAGSVEQMVLRSQTDESLRLRVEQLTAVTRVSRELVNIADPAELLKTLHGESVRMSSADCGVVFLFETSAIADQLPPVKMLHGTGCAEEMGPIEQRVFDRNLPARVEDYLAEVIAPPHDGVRSSLSVPLFQRHRMAGIISLHSREPGHFDDPTVESLQSLAIQAGIALANASQSAEHARRSMLLAREMDTLTELLRVTQMLRPSMPLEQSLTAISGAIRQATPFQVAVISVYDPEDQLLRRVVGEGLPAEQWAEMQNHRLPWDRLSSLLLPEFKTGGVYYIPADKTPVIPPEIHTLPVTQEIELNTADAWNVDDFLLVPLYDSQHEPLGLISVDVPSDGRRPDRPTFEALEIFAIQAGLMIENYRRTATLVEEVGRLEKERAGLAHVADAARQNLPVYLRKDLEQTVDLQGLNQRVERMRSLLDIAGQANAEADISGVLQALCRGLLTRFSMQTALVAERPPSGIHLVEVVGSMPEGANPNALLGQRNPLRRLLQDNDREVGVLLAANVENDDEWRSNPLLSALEARSFICLRLSGALHPTAVLVCGRHSLGAFLEEDHRIFEQITRQVSTALQNLRLLSETKRRLDEVNLLLEFSLKLSSLRPEDIFGALLQSVRNALPYAQAGWVGLLNEQGTAIVPHASVGYVDDDSHRKIHYNLFSTTGLLGSEAPLLLTRVYRSGEPLRVDEVEFASQYHLSAGDLLHYRQATGGRLPVACMILPLRLGDQVSGMLVLENFESQGAFSPEDEALAYSFSQQASLALDNARLFSAAEARASQLQNLTLASETLTSSLKQEELIGSLLDLLGSVVAFETATLWMRRGDLLTVMAAQGFEDNASRIGLSAAVEDSALFLEMIRTGEPIAVSDVRGDPRFPSLVEPTHLAWLGLPLIVKGEVIGLLALEKNEAGFYTPEHIQAASTFAGQAAGALENARLFEESVRRAGELDQRSNRLALLNQLSEELGSSLDIQFILKLTAQHLLSATNASHVACVMLGPGDKFILEAEVPPQATTLPFALLDAPLFERLKDSHGIFSTDRVADEDELAAMYESYFEPRGIISLLVVPLITGTTLHGWLMIQKDVYHRFSVSEIELARTVCNQAAIAIQNARLFDETRNLTEFLERRVEERTAELRHEHQNSQTLLKVISELSASLDMGLVLNRALAVINESLGSQESMTLLLEGSARPYRSGALLVGAQETEADGLAFERNVMRQVAATRRSLILEDVTQDENWQGEAAYRSLLAAPLVMGEDALGALLLFHRDPGYFRAAQTSLAEATARQIAITINNAGLFNLIRDQSEHLGNMLREQQIESSRSRAILEAVADGVIVTDTTGQVTLFNASAERILDLPTSEVVGKTLDKFGGLLGRSGSEWLRTVNRWSQDAGSFQGENFADEIDLDNGNVIAVHLAPVFWRSQFLGTVSILRDITHEVQVDRMKSEFVANVSHELRTPMTSIKGYVEIMLLGATGELTERQRHFLEIVRSNTERLGALVNDLLDLSRIESGRVTLHLQPVDLKEISQEVLLDVERRSQEENKPMTFRLEVEEDLPKVTGDLERIRQVIDNLVSNGYNYTPPNGTVTLQINHSNGEVQVDVQDTGIGIGLEEQQRMFERFFRGDHPLVLATAGTGLGLAVAKSLVNMHNGRIWFTSSGVRGEGSTFSFTLPVHQNNHLE